ncbi:hypothetical protein EV426DRAFT_709641 [Tirmania nivea]|nr:hypothetical protein EV426DRAFT_709641 [Tirmania nivea]
MLETADTQQRDMNALRTELDAQQRVTTLLQTQLDESRTLSAALGRAVPAAAPRLRKIPKPKAFDGSRSKLQAFITQLRLHTATFTDKQAKLRLAVNCLTGEDLDHARIYVQDDRVNLTIIAALITVLENGFGNSNRVGNV